MLQWRPENSAMTFDEVSMERSKSFVSALQELKSLRPQLYSAAEYCEKSYLHSEQKHMVLDNLKDYAVRALVNAVDHLGTVAYKLTDLFEQQSSDISTVDLKISCLNQQILACQTYADKEGLRQQQMSAATPRHHKHYNLPRADSSLQQQPDAANNHIHAKPYPQPSAPPATKTFCWLLAPETNSASNGAPNVTLGVGDSKAPMVISEVFNVKDAEAASAPLPLSIHVQPASRPPSSKAVPHMFGLGDPAMASNPRREICHPPAHNKSLLAIFFAKNKSMKQKKAYVAQRILL